MSVIGILLMILGHGSALYGIYQNYSFRQLSRLEQEIVALIDSGASNIGLVWIVLGVIVFAVGLAMLIISYRKRCAEDRQKN